MTSDWASYFDAAAADYDATTRGGWFPNQHAEEVLAGLGIAPASVLDLGAGTGQTAEVLARLYPGAALTLVDGSAGMADVARARLPQARVVVADVDAFLVEEGSTYDLVTAVGFLELVPDLARTLALATTRLGDGGHLLVTHEPLLPGETVQSDALTVIGGPSGRTVRRLTAADVERVATDVGLRRVASREFVAYRRGETEEPAVYELVVWERRPA